uniref:F-box protein AT5G49610-like beta-propeller domain-containing protein n=1 Tax=Leersia perrieri TaxID=77586 RepID=A0A0D9VEA6_9ORYZ
MHLAAFTRRRLADGAISSQQHFHPIFFGINALVPGVLIGDSLYWLLFGIWGAIIEFDLKKQMLAVIYLPMGLRDDSYKHLCVMPAVDGGLGFIFISELELQFWRKKAGRDLVVSSSVLEKTIELGELLSLSSEEVGESPYILGFSEVYNVIFLKTIAGVFMVHLQTLEFKKLSETNGISLVVYPFTSVYTTGSSLN